MKISVAGRFSDRERVKEIYKLIKSKGHELTGDWTTHIQVIPYDKEQDRSRKYSIEDIDSVVNCDIFILLLNKEAGAGSSTELGAAIALNVKLNKPKVYIVGEHIGNNMFNFHPSVIHRRNIEEVLNELEN